MEEINKAKRYLEDVNWPKELGVRYTVTKTEVTLYIKRFDWMLLPPEDVVKAEHAVNQTMTWLLSNGYPAKLVAE